jgi:hypothetical protein
MGRRKRKRMQATSTSPPAAQFKEELEVFRTDVEVALQFLYGYLTIHAVAHDTKAVYRSINSSVLFWNTNLAGLQTAAFIALGRDMDGVFREQINRFERKAALLIPLASMIVAMVSSRATAASFVLTDRCRVRRFSPNSAVLNSPPVTLL